MLEALPSAYGFLGNPAHTPFFHCRHGEQVGQLLLLQPRAKHRPAPPGRGGPWRALREEGCRICAKAAPRYGLRGGAGQRRQQRERARPLTHPFFAGKLATKGLGRTHPNPSEEIVLDVGTIVPLGKGVDSKVSGTSLLYNEYIVYDTSQIQLRYLLRVKFNYKY